MICKALLGGPVATPSAKEFGERFGLETLYGAVAWIRDDAINEGDRLDPQRFKTVVTGEAIDIDRKNKPAVRDVRLDIPVLLTANSLARVRDSTDAVFNRSIILTMTNVISIEAAHAARVAAGAGEQSIGQAVFEREASGILNWALEGLVRLRKRGFYNIPESIKAAITQYKDDNNPVGQWAREALEADPYSRVARADVVRAYNGWELEQEGEDAHAHGARWLLPRLRNQIKGLGDYQNDDGTRYITGVKLTKLGLAMWTSYGMANPRNGPGGFSTSASEVNRLYKMGVSEVFLGPFKVLAKCGDLTTRQHFRNTSSTKCCGEKFAATTRGCEGSQHYNTSFRIIREICGEVSWCRMGCRTDPPDIVKTYGMGTGVFLTPQTVAGGRNRGRKVAMVETCEKNGYSTAGFRSR